MWAGIEDKFLRHICDGVMPVDVPLFISRWCCDNGLALSYSIHDNHIDAQIDWGSGAAHTRTYTHDLSEALIECAVLAHESRHKDCSPSVYDAPGIPA